MATKSKAKLKRLELTFFPFEKMPRTIKNVTSYGISDGALGVATDDGTNRYHHVFVLRPGDMYEADLTNTPRPEA